MRYLLILCLFSSFYTNAQVSLDYYLNDNIDYNDNYKKYSPVPCCVLIGKSNEVA